MLHGIKYLHTHVKIHFYTLNKISSMYTTTVLLLLTFFLTSWRLPQLTNFNLHAQRYPDSQQSVVDPTNACPMWIRPSTRRAQ